MVFHPGSILCGQKYSGLNTCLHPPLHSECPCLHYPGLHMDSRLRSAFKTKNTGQNSPSILPLCPPFISRSIFVRCLTSTNLALIPVVWPTLSLHSVTIAIARNVLAGEVVLSHLILCLSPHSSMALSLIRMAYRST